MHTIGEHLFTNSGWEIVKDRYEKAQAINEGSTFMIGNGFLGYRGTFAEDGKDAYAACVVTDTWDKADGKWEELSTVPNALWTNASINGEPFAMDEEVDSFERQLDLRHGLTSRAVKKRLHNGVTVTITEEKFASYDKKQLVAMDYRLTVDRPAEIVLSTGIDQDVWSLNGDHLGNHRTETHPDGLLVQAETVTYQDEVVVAEKFQLSHEGEEEALSGEACIGRTIAVQLAAGEPLRLTKYMVVLSSNDHSNPKQAAMEVIGALGSYEQEKESHSRQWEALWNQYDVEIHGNVVDQVAMRFNIYHQIIATPVHKSLPIGARGLSCQAYQGAAFWDQEIYNMPMFLYNNPPAARRILEYRYHTLDGARRKAKRLGYEGAYYAWISGKTGDELCPDFFFKDVLSGRDIRNHFNDWQIHISPDIAYAVKKYFHVTKDSDFLEQYGAEMVFEIARFLASHAVYKPMRQRYEFVRVQGPDEYHENVDNNAFTNYQAHAALAFALDLLQWMDETVLHDVRERIGLTDDEIELWQDMYAKLYLPKPGKGGLIEQFDGYFDLESIVPAQDVTKRLIQPDEYYGHPNGVAVWTQCIKQADLIQLFVLYPMLFSQDLVEKNYEYYEPRTLHFSSLSPSSYAIAAARIGKKEEAYRNFRKAVMIDLLNTNEAVSGGTFIGGIHTANNGASWQMAVHGFGGVHFEEDVLYLNPTLPREWSGMTFNLVIAGQHLEVTVQDNKVRLHNQRPTGEALNLSVNGQTLVFDGEEAELPLEQR